MKNGRMKNYEFFFFVDDIRLLVEKCARCLKLYGSLRTQKKHNKIEILNNSERII